MTSWKLHNTPHMNDAGKPFAATSIRNMVTRGKADNGKQGERVT
jgi:hypothetical protein